MPNECCRGANYGLKFIYNHNPFYIVSALLVLVGLHVSFAESLNPTEGRLLSQLLMGYTVLLAATAVLIVRLGQVWEDARTLVLLVILLMVTLAAGFDRVCLDDEIAGAKLLAGGLAFSLLVSETLLAALPLRLGWLYRLPFYLILSLLFAYPAWLGHLSLDDRVAEMSWFVLGFPSIAAALFLLLVPAARRRGHDVARHGTPWAWPFYPWSLFAILGIGVLLRAVAMSLSFDPTEGLTIGFQLFFVIPLLMSWLVLWVEGSDVSTPRQELFAVGAPLALLAMALPGPSSSLAEEQYVRLLGDAAGSPIQITAVLLLVYFAYLRLRGARLAEIGLLLTLCVFAFVDRATVDLDTLAPVNPAPIAVGALLLIVGSFWYGSSVRMCVAVLIMMIGGSVALRETAFVAFRGYLPIHLLVLTIASLGMLFHDWLGRWIATAAAIVLASAAVFAAVGNRLLFPELSPATHAAPAIVFAVLATAYWRKNRRFADLVAAVVCLAVGGFFLGEQLLGSGFAHLLLRGKQWMAWGAVAFAIGLYISLAKGGQIKRLCRVLLRLHEAVHRTRAP